MGIDLYYLEGSPPCCTVLLTAKAVGVELNVKVLDFVAKEHLKPEFLKINPQHTVPALVDDGFILWESRAIQAYLVDKYAKNDSLYPKCLEKRALVNQRLYFDLGTLYARLADYYYPQLFNKVPLNPEKLKKLEDAVGFLNTFLEGNTYAAGDVLTIADISLVTTVSTMECFNFDLSKYDNILRWYANMKVACPGYDRNEKRVADLKTYLDSKKP